MHLLLVLLTAAISSQPLKADTNGVFRTDSTGIEEEKGKMKAGTQNSKEELPADKFPEGNWGEPKDGLQLSLRLDKNTYAPGEPICATMLLRNVTNVGVKFFSPLYYGSDRGPIALPVVDERSKPVPLVAHDDIGAVSISTGFIPPGTQKKFVEHLEGRFQLSTNGTYFVTARAGLIRADRMAVSSAKVQFRIVQPAKESK